jgi:hypothetical protein
MSSPVRRTHDGVGVVARGDLFLVLYGADARLHRTRWLFDRADEIVPRFPGGALVMLVITANADPPDAATRAENARRLERLKDALRGFVTVPLGDSVRVHIARAIMRAMLLIQGKADLHRIARNEADGIREILLRAGPDTPSGGQIRADLADLHAEIDPIANAARRA